MDMYSNTDSVTVFCSILAKIVTDMVRCWIVIISCIVTRVCIQLVFCITFRQLMKMHFSASKWLWPVVQMYN